MATVDVDISRSHTEPLGVFRYIYKQHRKGVSDEDVLENRYYKAEDLADKFVVAGEYDTNKYKYYVFRSIDSFELFLKNTNEAERCFHEVIFGWANQKLKIDIDGANINVDPTEMLDAIDDAIIDTFYLLYGISLPRYCIITTDSSGICDGVHKFSFHKIIDGYYVENHEEAKEFTRRFLQMLPSEYYGFIDRGVNKQLQNFRMIGCHKFGSERTKKIMPMDKTLFTDAGIDVDDVPEPKSTDTIIQYTASCEKLPCVITTKKSTKSYELMQDDVDVVIEMASPFLGDAHVLKRNTDNTSLLCFKRVKPSYCDLCERTHDNDNTAMISITVMDGVGTAYLKCRHADADKVKYLGQFCSIGSDNDLADSKFIAAKKERMTNIIQKVIMDPPDFSDKRSVRNLPEEQKNVYCEPQLRDYEHVDTLAIIAGMKMGKTKKLVEYINKHHADTPTRKTHIKFISFRQTFSANIKEKFPDFTLYSDVSGDLRARKLIVQVESLHRMIIDPNTPAPDLVVLDESELILEQFDSGLLKQFNRSWATFKWLLQSASHVICMDATLSDRTINTLERMRRGRKIYLHHNTYKNASNDVYHFTACKNSFYAQMFKDMDEGLRIAIPMSSLAEAETAQSMIAKRYPDKIIGFYSSKTSTSVKTKHFDDIETYWSTYDVLIYTPTVSAGVSFESKHFHKVYAYFTDMSCNVEVCLQMLGRVRDVGLREYVVCVDINGGYYSTTIDEIKTSLYRSRENLFKQLDDSLLSFEYTEDGCMKYHESDYFYLWLENTKVRNISKNGFIKRLARYLYEYGASMQMLEINETNATLKDICEENKETKKEIHKNKITAVALAPDLTEQQLADLKNKMVRQDDVTEEEINAYNRFKMRRDYNYGGEMSEEFVSRYSNRKLKRQFKNLKRIMCHEIIEFALDKIRQEERDMYAITMDGDSENQYHDVNRKYVYDQHRVAMAIIVTCGWDHITDTKYKSETELFDNLHSSESELYRLLVANYSSYNIRPPDVKNFRYHHGVKESAYIANLVGYFNRILDIMYGVRIIVCKSDCMYKLSSIKHFSLSKDLSQEETKPNIHALWMPSNIQLEDVKIIEQKNKDTAQTGETAIDEKLQNVNKLAHDYIDNIADDI